MKIGNPSKAFILLIGLLCVVVLIALGKVSPDQGLPIVSAVIFYGIGNGVAARSGKPSSPIIEPKDGASD